MQDDLRSLRDKLSLSEDATLNWKDFLSGTIDKTLAMREDNIRMLFNHFKHGADADHLKYEDVVEILPQDAVNRVVRVVVTAIGPVTEGTRGPVCPLAICGAITWGGGEGVLSMVGKCGSLPCFVWPWSSPGYRAVNVVRVSMQMSTKYV